MKVLVADDSQFMRKAIKQLIDEEVVEASTEEEAVRQFNEHRPDVVFLDIMMNEADSGVKALRRIKEQSPGANVVLVTSLKEDNSLVQEAFELGVKGYLTKPFDKRELLKFLE
ncbi:MAG: response regulator transcription factor [Candidatus Nanoarchaeia archaeon]